MSSLTFLITVLVLSNLQLVHLQDLNAQTNVNQANVNPGVNNVSVLVQNVNPEQNAVKLRFEEWKKSPLYLPSFEPDVITIPQPQKEFVNNMIINDMELFREILREAINKRNTFSPSSTIMWKYTGKLISRIISNRREEQRIVPRKEPVPAFFGMLADLADQVIERSDEIKREKGYNKNSVISEVLYQRVDSIFKYIERTIIASPVGGYMKFAGSKLFKDEMSNPDYGADLIEHAGDLVAQFRAMGYDKCIFVARRIINILRMFSKGSIPNEDGV